MKHFKKLSCILSFAGLLLGPLVVQAGEKGWLTNYEEALSQAKEEGKIILVEFHGSDWCPPCIQLNNNILTKDEFKSLADSKLVLVNVDFPRKSKLPEAQAAYNGALAQQFGVQYFPTVLLINSDGQVLDKVVGLPRGGLEGFLEFISAQTD